MILLLAKYGVVVSHICFFREHTNIIEVYFNGLPDWKYKDRQDQENRFFSPECEHFFENLGLNFTAVSTRIMAETS